MFNKFDIRSIQEQVDIESRNRDLAKDQWTSNAFKQFFFKEEKYSKSEISYHCVKAVLTYNQWKKDVGDLVAKGSSEEGLSTKAEATAKLLLNCNDAFLEAAMVFEIANFFVSPLISTLGLSFDDIPKAEAKARRQQTERAKKIVNACDVILEAYEILTKFGLKPGPGPGVGEPNFLSDIITIRQEYEKDCEVLEQVPVVRIVNGAIQEYESSKRSRHQDAPRYLILHLRELLSGCLDRSMEEILPILLPLASRLGAIDEDSQLESLSRKLKDCDVNAVRRDFFTNHDSIIHNIPNNLRTTCLTNLLNKLDKLKSRK